MPMVTDAELIDMVNRWAKTIREMNRVRAEMNQSGKSVLFRSRKMFGASMRKFAILLGKENTFPMISKIEAGKEPLTRPLVLKLDVLFRDRESESD